MANPNYKRKGVADPKTANEKELTSAKWFEIPSIVTIPSEIYYYAVDQKVIDKDAYRGANKAAKIGRDQVVLQIHRYLDNAAWPSSRKYVPVGEWSVAERVVVNRGEIIDRPVRVEVPLFVPELSEWRLGSTPTTGETGANREPGIDVPFYNVPNWPAILVDFDGGDRLKYKHGTEEVADSSSLEVIILGPEGKLLAHNGAVDAKNKERIDRYTAWKARIEEVRKKQGDDPKAPRNPFDKGRP